MPLPFPPPPFKASLPGRVPLADIPDLAAHDA